jgi:hypothetical protein
MTPGADVIESVYDRVIDRADDLTKALNDKFGKKVFQTKLSRDGGELNVLVAFVESDGGVFQCKSEADGGSYAVALRCPNDDQLKIAFNAMAQVPTPDADMDGDIDANDAPDLEDAQQYNEGMASNTQDYVDRRLVKALNKAGISYKAVKKAGYTSYEIWPGYEIVNDGKGITVMKDGKKEDYFDRPKRNYKKAVEQVKIGRRHHVQRRLYTARALGPDIDLGEEMDDLGMAVELVGAEVQQEAKEDEIDSEDMDPSLAPEMEVDPDYELPQNIVINEGELSAEDQGLYDLAKKVYHQAETGSDLEKLSYGIMTHLKSMVVAGTTMNTEARKKAELLLGRLCEDVPGTSVAGAIAGGQSPAPAVVSDAGPRKKTKHKFVTLQRHGMTGGPFS